MYQHVMLGETNERVFRCKFEGLALLVLLPYSFGCIQTNHRLDYTKENILTQINRIN
jgi:hypothetical protein